MHVTVHFLASLRHSTGTPSCTLEVPEEATLAQAVEALLAHFPDLSGHQDSWHFAINQMHAEADVRLRPGDTISIFPYIAGG